MTKRGGFTLVELVVVIIAVGVLATLGLLAFNRYQEVQQQKVETAENKQDSQQTTQPETGGTQTIEIAPTANKPTGQVPTTSATPPTTPPETQITPPAINPTNTAKTLSTPKPYSLTSSNNPTSLTAIAGSAMCPSDTRAYYQWKANNTHWVQGFQYDTITYSLSPGQSVTLQVFVRCEKGGVVGEYVASSNTVTQKRASTLRSISNVN